MHFAKYMQNVATVQADSYIGYGIWQWYLNGWPFASIFSLLLLFSGITLYMTHGEIQYSWLQLSTVTFYSACNILRK